MAGQSGAEVNGALPLSFRLPTQPLVPRGHAACPVPTTFSFLAALQPASHTNFQCTWAPPKICPAPVPTKRRGFRALLAMAATVNSNADLPTPFECDLFRLATNGYSPPSLRPYPSSLYGGGKCLLLPTGFAGSRLADVPCFRVTDAR